MQVLFLHGFWALLILISYMLKFCVIVLLFRVVVVVLSIRLSDEPVLGPVKIAVDAVRWWLKHAPKLSLEWQQFEMLH